MPEARLDRLVAELTYLEQIEQQTAPVKPFVETALSETVKRRHAREVARLETCRKARLLRLEKTVRDDCDLAQRLDLLISIKGSGCVARCA